MRTNFSRHSTGVGVAGVTGEDPPGIAERLQSLAQSLDAGAENALAATNVDGFIAGVSDYIHYVSAALTIDKEPQGMEHILGSEGLERYRLQRSLKIAETTNKIIAARFASGLRETVATTLRTQLAQLQSDDTALLQRRLIAIPENGIFQSIGRSIQSNNSTDTWRARLKELFPDLKALLIHGASTKNDTVERLTPEKQEIADIRARLKQLQSALPHVIEFIRSPLEMIDSALDRSPLLFDWALEQGFLDRFNQNVPSSQSPAQ